MARSTSFLLALSAAITLIGSAQEETVIPVSASEDILNGEGKELLVEGVVSSTRINASGIHFLEFANTNFVCVTFAQQAAAFGVSPPSETYKGKRVRVRGKIELFRGTPQLKLLSPTQIEILKDAPPPAVAAIPPPVSPTPLPAEAAKPRVAPPKPTVPDVEVVDEVPAIEWRQFFPPAKP